MFFLDCLLTNWYERFLINIDHFCWFLNHQPARLRWLTASNGASLSTTTLWSTSQWFLHWLCYHNRLHMIDYPAAVFVTMHIYTFIYLYLCTRDIIWSCMYRIYYMKCSPILAAQQHQPTWLQTSPGVGYDPGVASSKMTPTFSAGRIKSRVRRQTFCLALGKTKSTDDSWCIFQI